MSKFTHYISPSKYLAGKFPRFKKLSKLYYSVNKFDNEAITNVSFTPRLSDLFLGGLHPLMAIGKDVIDTFKPYKSKFHIQRDALQFFRGIGNILRGLFNLAAAILVFLFNTIGAFYCAVKSSSSVADFFYSLANHLALNFARFSGWLLDGATALIRGIGQVIATPLTWLLRMPLRGTITAATGMPTIKDSLKSRAEKAIALINKQSKSYQDGVMLDNILDTVYRKISKGSKAEKRGQQRGNIDLALLQQKYLDCESFAIKQPISSGSSQRKYSRSVNGHTYLRFFNEDDNAKQNALEFFSLFTHKSMKTPIIEDPLNAIPMLK